MSELLLEDEIHIDAPPSRVWELVGDVRRMPEWSPQVSSTRLRRGFERVEPGAEFTNLNVLGELEWVTHGKIVRFEPERQIAFRIAENYVVWSFRLQAGDADSTRLLQRREAPEGISELSLKFMDSHLGGQEPFNDVMRAGMRQTLERVKVAAES